MAMICVSFFAGAVETASGSIAASARKASVIEGLPGIAFMNTLSNRGPF
jgi:hypothetical protein